MALLGKMDNRGLLDPKDRRVALGNLEKLGSLEKTELLENQGTMLRIALVHPVLEKLVFFLNHLLKEGTRLLLLLREIMLPPKVAMKLLLRPPQLLMLKPKEAIAIGEKNRFLVL